MKRLVMLGRRIGTPSAMQAVASAVVPGYRLALETELRRQSAWDKLLACVAIAYGRAADDKLPTIREEIDRRRTWISRFHGDGSVEDEIAAVESVLTDIQAGRL